MTYIAPRWADIDGPLVRDVFASSDRAVTYQQIIASVVVEQLNDDVSFRVDDDQFAMQIISSKALKTQF